ILNARNKQRLRRWINRPFDPDYACVQRLGCVGTKLSVERRHGTLYRTKISGVELQIDDAIACINRGHAALDDGAPGDNAAVKLVNLHAGAPSLGAGSADKQVALSHGVHLPIGTL